MKTNSRILLIIISIIGILLFLFPLQMVYATGPTFEDLYGEGFIITEGEYWTTTITVAESKYGIDIDFNVGDKFLFNITKTNNSLLSGSDWSSPWIADTVWAYMLYYNSTNATWHGISGICVPYKEYLLAAYNSTTPFYQYKMYPPGQYYCYTAGMDRMLENQIFLLDIIPLNFSAANHTIVNMTYTLFTLLGPDPTFNFSTPANTSIVGTWSMWNGSATTTNSLRIDYAFNDKGICIVNRLYVNGTTNWDLIFECRTIEGLPWELLLLFLPGGMPDPPYILIGASLTLAFAIIPLIIALLAKKART